MRSTLPTCNAGCKRREWKTKDGSVRLYLGDSLEIAQTVGQFDAIVTDPPYGISHRVTDVSKKMMSPGTVKLRKAWSGETIEGDESTETRDRLLSMFPSHPAAIFADITKPVAGLNRALIWFKPHMCMPRWGIAFRKNFEVIWLRGRWRYEGVPEHAVLTGPPPPNNETRGRVHPHEKPVWLLEKIISRMPGEVVFDPFMGSGTTGVACVRTGRKFIGIEKTEKYFLAAIKKIKAELDKSALLSASGLA